MLEALRVAAGTRFRVLDLGCGTGSLSERILRRFPRARSVAVDHDPVLLRVGRVGLGSLGGRLTWVDADLRRPDWPGHLPPGRFDAAVSTTALHWFTAPELEGLYARVAGLLRTGGCFLNGDRIAWPPSSPGLSAWGRSVLRARGRSAGVRGARWNQWWRDVLRDPRLSEEARLHRLRYPHAHSRTPTPDLAGHVRLLKKVGFREVELIWTRWENRVLAARR